jgi:general secretion pathway protein H
MRIVLHPRRDAPARVRASAGFTLIEILVVISLVAGLTVILMMSMNGGMNGMRLRSEARTIASELRRARSQAISTGTVQAFRIVPEDRTWTGARDRKGEIPKPLVVTFTGVRQVLERDGEGVILFFEDGASTGGRIQLKHERAALNVDVAWLTGEVSLHRGEADAR